MEEEKEWWIYIVACSDESLYTGITIDRERRIAEHNDSKKGAKYTRNRRPVDLVYSEMLPNRSAASKREYEIKKLSRADKLKLIGS
jgi:putative endonuclease